MNTRYKNVDILYSEQPIGGFEISHTQKLTCSETSSTFLTDSLGASRPTIRRKEHWKPHKKSLSVVHGMKSTGQQQLLQQREGGGCGPVDRPLAIFIIIVGISLVRVHLLRCRAAPRCPLCRRRCPRINAKTTTSDDSLFVPRSPRSFKPPLNDALVSHTGRPVGRSVGRLAPHPRLSRPDTASVQRRGEDKRSICTRLLGAVASAVIARRLQESSFHYTAAFIRSPLFPSVYLLTERRLLSTPSAATHCFVFSK